MRVVPWCRLAWGITPISPYIMWSFSCLMQPSQSNQAHLDRAVDCLDRCKSLFHCFSFLDMPHDYWVSDISSGCRQVEED